MAKTRGEGRSNSEKAGRLIDPEYRRRRARQAKAERDRFDELAGPVTVTRKEST